ncbi:MAG: hypothetical protein Q9200_006460, partial [Gallowayella weberi]
MRLINLLIVFLVTFASDIIANAAAPSNIVNGSAVSLGVVQPQDIGIDRLWKGRSLDDHSLVISTLYVAQLELYRRTVHNPGDAALPYMDIRTELGLRLELRALEKSYNHMSLGYAFYGVQFLIQTMLLPQSPADDFLESSWRIWSKAVIPGSDVPVGYLNLLLGDPKTE